MKKQINLRRFKALPKRTRILTLFGIVGFLCICCMLPVVFSDDKEDVSTAAIIETSQPAATEVFIEPTFLPTETSTEVPTATSTPTNIPTQTATRVPTEELATATLVQAKLHSCLPENGVVEVGRVVSITDGDTIRVEINGIEYPVRYIGMDTPEINDSYSVDATNRNAQLVDGKDVFLVKDVSDVDRYGRLLRYVFVDGVFVNAVLVEEGYAYAKAYPPDTSCQTILSSAEVFASSLSVGLWQASRSGGVIVVDTPAPVQAGSACPQGCTQQEPGCEIKGNINSEGVKIYHDYSSSSYSQTKIDPSKGERWFCTAEEAVANGWRAPRN